MPGVGTSSLRTVRVPPAFAPVFLRAQDYVRRYFLQKEEDPEKSTIRISGERYILVRAASMSVEFVDLVTSLYADRGPSEARAVANNLLFDLAHALGKADARSFQAKMGVADPIEKLSAGPIHFSFAGWAFVDILPESRPTPDEGYFLIYDHPFSFESDAWVSRGRRSDGPVCIMNSGYSSGWCEESFGLPLVAAEIECLAAGGSRCRFVMAPPGRIEEHVARCSQTGTEQRPNPSPVGLSGAGERVTVPEFFQRKRLEDEVRKHQELLERRVEERTAALEHQALHDGLTGLPNRLLLHDRLSQALLTASRLKTPLALLFMDLDRFKEVNDTFGHHVGDQLLQQVGERLRQAVRAADSVSRLGGDEFAVLLPRVDGVAAAVTAARRVLGALESPFVVDAHVLDVGASIGIALAPEHGADSETLMRRADVAMYVAKETHGGHAVYSAEQDHHSKSRLALRHELKAAVESSGLLLHYQPKLDLRTGAVCGLEALVRWNHPRHGLLSPEVFLPVAERSGLMEGLTQRVLAEALGACALWRGSGLNLGVAVNVPARGLQDAQFETRLLRLLAYAALPPDCLTLEIAERSLIPDGLHIASILERLRSLGLRVSIDDFGTGHASLVNLKDLPADEIKIDGRFIRGMARSASDTLLARSAIDLGHAFGRTVVAEGVEDAATLDLLRDWGCDFAQGYEIGRPGPLEGIVEQLGNLKPPLL